LCGIVMTAPRRLRLLGPRGPENVEFSGTLACNDIDVVLRWVHDGHGIVMSGDCLAASAATTLRPTPFRPRNGLPRISTNGMRRC
jgi:hypothetical protein